MGKRLQVPPELEHLIEKREAEEDRLRRDDRAGDDRRQEDVGPLGAIESAAQLDEVPTEERRGQSDRRKGDDRRRKSRRNGGSSR
jgi:hypothetical protein